MQQQQNTASYLPTIRQLHQDLKQAYIQVDQTFKQIGMIPLSSDEDLEVKKITLKKVLANIPPEVELQAKTKDTTTQEAKIAVSRYVGDNQLILKAKENFNEIKKEQKKIYYLAAQFSAASVSPQFKEKVDTNLSNFHSFRDVSEVKKTKIKALQKNSISESYFQQGQSQLDVKNQPVIKVSKKSPQLKNLDLLVHVNFYDSHNSEKQYEFVCVQDQNLGSLVQKFRCLIDTLKNVQKLRRKPENDMENYEIYDKFYQPTPERNTSKIHSMPRNQAIASSLKYLFIQDTIYYEGNKKQLQPLLASAYSQSKTQYRCLELNKTKLSDLRVVFGRPYLYRHLQGCDHIIIFKEARLFMEGCQFSTDIPQVDRYPLTVFESKMKRKKCEACSQYFSEVVVIGDVLKNGDNFYLCSGCHQDLHYDEKGNLKIDDKIKVINYIHD